MMRLSGTPSFTAVLETVSSYASIGECHLCKPPLQFEDSWATFTQSAGHAVQDQISDLGLYLSRVKPEHCAATVDHDI